MKKEIKKVILLAIILIIISSITILIMGKTCTITFDTNNKKITDLAIDGEENVEILEKKLIGSKYIVKLKAKKPGNTYFFLEYDEYKEGKNVVVHKSHVITSDSFFGKSNGSEIIPISLSIFLIYCLYLLIKRYKYTLTENIYQYKNIAYLGIIIYLSFFTLSNLVSIFHYQGLQTTINDTINSLSFVSVIMLPIALVTFILVTISNINLIRKEGKSLKNLLGLFLGIFICVLTFLPDNVYKFLMKSQIVNIYNLNRPGPYLYNFFESLVYLTVAYLECVLLATIIIAIKSIRKKPEMNKDYIIILGCQIKKDGTLTPLLKGRVDRALEFRNEQLKETKKDLVFVTSGGQGKDEIISEGEAMKNYLLDQGIKAKNILVEAKSKNTNENIKFSNKLINNKKANIAFSTTNYHVMRAGLIATEQGLKLEGMGSKTKSYFWINAFIREFIGTLYSERKKHIIFFLSMAAFIALMILLTYVGNNI